MSPRISPPSDISDSAVIGAGTRIWHYAQVREGAEIGVNCSIGRGAYIGSGVPIGDRVKIQNYALVYEPAEIGDGVFIGPGAVLTNDSHPRAVTPEGQVKQASDWHPAGVLVATGASIGANATCVAPVRIGEWAVVAAGAVVTEDVAPFSLVAGVPARQIGWVGRAGKKLLESDNGLKCPVTGTKYRVVDGTLEEDPLRV